MSFYVKKLFITDRGQICSDKHAQLRNGKHSKNLQNKLRQTWAYENIAHHCV